MKSQTCTSEGKGGRRLKSPLGLLVTLTALFSVVALLASSAAMADEEAKGCQGPAGRPTSNLVGAGVTTSGNESTYTFTSVDTGSTKGVPGLVEYCVFPGAKNTLPGSVTVDTTPGTGAVGWNGDPFEDPSCPEEGCFSFHRNKGDESNIPLDGTTRTMGTATWAGGAPAAADQIIILHINDETECNRLGQNSATCWVLPGEPEEEIPPADALTASKDATPSFERTFAWEIEKEADKTKINVAEGGTATFEYTVTVKHDEGTDSGWAVSGEITVNNPNSGAVTGVDIEDSIDDTSSECTATGGSGATIPAESSKAFPYECTYSAGPSSKSETNTATVSWGEQTVDGKLLDEGTAEATAPVDWEGTEPTIVDGSVEVTDTLGGTLGTVSYSDPSPKTFTYSHEFEGDPAGTCTGHDNTATFTTNDSGTEGSASQEVEVCVGADLTAEKTATPSFNRTFEWDIEKEVDKTKVEIAKGGAATFEYTVTVTHDSGTDSGWAVSGAITVDNPNDWEPITVDVADEIEGDANATCTVSEGEDAEIPASGSKEFEYECTYSAAPESNEETNTATVTWDKEAASTPNGSATGTAPVDWEGTEPTIVDGSVEVTDTLGGTLGTVSYSDPSPKTFTYSHEFEGDPAGTCTGHDNTATFTTNDSGTEGSASQEVEVCVGADLTAEKTATPSFKRTFPWSIKKEVDKTTVSQVGGNATFNYTITVTKGTGVDSDWVATGTITVKNPNDWEAITVDVKDAINDANASCTVSEGEDAEIPASGSKEFEYECTYSAAPESNEETNTATVTWDKEGASTPNGSATGTAPVSWASPTLVDNCVEVTDTVDGIPTTLDNPLCESKTYTPKLTFPVPKSGCLTHNNTAAFKTEDTGTTGEASQSVKVCGPADTGALTMGFWQNKNGQGIITGGASTGGVCNSATWLRQYAPFQDLSATAKCKDVASYVTNIIKAANASGAAMNAMLKAQMLATALDVYFSDPALGGNKIGAPAPIGGQKIDLTKVCKNIATCSVFENTSSAFGGATSLTVSQILAYAASQSNAGGSSWYGQVKATQELAKDTFDAINNEVAFGA